MGVSYETLTVFVFLIPGFLSSIILNCVIVRKEKDNLSIIVEALVFSLLIYFAIFLINLSSPITIIDSQKDNVSTYSIRFQSDVLFAVMFLAVIFPLAIGASINRDWHMWLLRKAKITTKTARANIWLDLFADQDRYVIVNFSDGRRLFGWPMYYSNTLAPEERSLYLYDPSWIDADGEYIDLGIHGILLTKEELIESIEFTMVSAANATDRGIERKES